MKKPPLAPLDAIVGASDASEGQLRKTATHVAIATHFATHHPGSRLIFGAQRDSFQAA